MEEFTLKELKAEWESAGWKNEMHKSFIRFEKGADSIDFYFDETYWIPKGIYINEELHILIQKTTNLLGWYQK